MNRPPALIALLQVIGVVAYVLLFVAGLNYLNAPDGPIFENNPAASMTFMLLAFVTSALICGALILGYPLHLYLSGEKRRAVTVVAWSALWFVIILALFAGWSLMAYQ